MISKKMFRDEPKTGEIKLSDINKDFLELDKNAIVLKFEKEESVNYHSDALTNHEL